MQKKSIGFGGLLAVLLALLFVPLAVASPDGATVNSLGTDRYNPNAAGTQNVVAGSIYHFDLTAQSSTNYWAGVYGNVSGSVQLRNAAGKDLFTLNVNSGLPNNNGPNINSFVLAYNNNAVPNLGGMTIQTGNNIDIKTGVSNVLTDSASNTFINTPSPIIIGNHTFTGGANSQFCPNTYNASSGLKFNSDCLFGEDVLADGTNNLLFVMPANSINWPVGGTLSSSKKLFDNVTFANYEGILYSNNSGTSASTQYSFYLELR